MLIKFNTAELRPQHYRLVGKTFFFPDGSVFRRNASGNVGKVIRENISYYAI